MQTLRVKHVAGFIQNAFILIRVRKRAQILHAPYFQSGFFPAFAKSCFVGAFIRIDKTAGQREKPLARLFCPFFKQHIPFPVGNDNAHGGGDVVIQRKSAVGAKPFFIAGKTDILSAAHGARIKIIIAVHEKHLSVSASASASDLRIVCMTSSTKSGMSERTRPKNPFASLSPPRMSCVLIISDALSKSRGIKRKTISVIMIRYLKNKEKFASKKLLLANTQKRKKRFN